MYDSPTTDYVKPSIAVDALKMSIPKRIQRSVWPEQERPL